MAFQPGQGAAGTEYNGVQFRNRGGSTCTISGYPGVSLLDGNQALIGQPAQRAPAKAAVVTLRPGDKATAVLTVQPAYCDSGIVSGASYVRVYPPGQTEASVIAAELPACHPIIRPVHAGTDLSAG